MSKQLIYEGFIRLDSNGEEDEILYLDTISSDRDKKSYSKYDLDPFAETLEESISNKSVTARYYISSKKITLEEANDKLIRQIYGVADVDYCMRYSEITGYLWTNEEINIGGHNLLDELKSYYDEYLILVIDIEE